MSDAAEKPVTQKSWILDDYDLLGLSAITAAQVEAKRREDVFVQAQLKRHDCPSDWKITVNGTTITATAPTAADPLAVPAATPQA